MTTETKIIEVRVKPGKVGLYGGRRWREGETVRVAEPECPNWKEWGVLVGTEADAAAKADLAKKLEATRGAGKRVDLSTFAKNAQTDDPTHERK